MTNPQVVVVYPGKEDMDDGGDGWCGGGAVMRMILIFAGWSGTGLKAGGPGIISSCKVLPPSFMIWQTFRE